MTNKDAPQILDLKESADVPGLQRCLGHQRPENYPYSVLRRVSSSGLPLPDAAFHPSRTLTESVPPRQQVQWQRLLRKAFSTGWGDLYKRPKFFRDYIDHDPHFRSENIVGLYLDGRLVSTYQVFLRQMIIGKEIYRLQGLGNIGTDPKFQRLGLGTTLMHQYLGRSDRYRDLAIVYTGMPNFYTRLGWQPLQRRRLRITKVPTLCNRAVPGTHVRRIKPEDVSHLERIYSRFNRLEGLPHVIRSAMYWKKWVLEWKFKIYRLIGELILTDDNRPIGYFLYSLHGDAIEIEEYGAMPREATRVYHTILSYIRSCSNVKDLSFLETTASLERSLASSGVEYQVLREADGFAYCFNETVKSPCRDRLFLWHVDHF